MAFSLPNYTDPQTGVSVTYFVIKQLMFNIIGNAFNISVDGYVTQQAYADGLLPAKQNIMFLVSGALYAQFLAAQSQSDIPAGSSQQQILGELLTTLSNNMLSLPFFQGATIVA